MSLPNNITGKIVAISRRGAYWIEVKDGKKPIRFWLRPKDVTGLNEGALEDNIMLSTDGMTCVKLAIEQHREHLTMDRRLA